MNPLTPSKNDGLVQILGQMTDAAQPPRNLWADARVRFFKNRAAVVSLAIFSIVLLMCVVGPWVLPHAFDTADWDAMSVGPSMLNAH